MALVDPAELSGVIGAIYESTYAPSRWNAVVGGLRSLFHGSKACIQRLGPDVGLDDSIATNPDIGFFHRLVNEHAGQPNVLSDAITSASVGAVYHDHALVGGDRLRKSRFWNEWMAPQDMHGGMGCKLLESGSSYWFVDIQRGPKQETFTGKDSELLRTLVPHLARAVEIGRNVRLAQGLGLAVSRLPFGVILLDSHLRVVNLNPAAETILVRPEARIKLKAGYLSASDLGEMARLQELVVKACLVREGVWPGVGGDLLVRSRGAGKGVDLALSIAPLLGPTENMPFVGRLAVIFVREVTLGLPDGFEDQMRALFGLTPREAAIAACLASGRTLKQAALDNQIQFTTARSCLEKIFAKTDTHQQSQLVALLKSAQSLAGKAPIR